MYDESDNGWRQGEGDGLHHAIDVHGIGVRRARHGHVDGARQQHLHTWTCDKVI